jgi:hypothetical protein
MLIGFKGTHVDQKSRLACVRSYVAYPFYLRPKDFMQMHRKQPLVGSAKKVRTAGRSL